MSEAAKASELVPEAFYDLIGRIVPGSIGVGLILLSTDTTVQAVSDRLLGTGGALADSAFFVGLLVLLMSYVVGQAISPLSALMHRWVVPRAYKRQFSVVERIANGSQIYPEGLRAQLRQQLTALHGDYSGMTDRRFRQSIYLWYDTVRVRDPSRGIHLAKIRAEYRMLEGIYSVSAVALIVHLLLSDALIGVGDIQFSLGITLVLLGTFLYFTFAASRMFETFQLAVISSLLIGARTNDTAGRGPTE